MRHPQGTKLRHFSTAVDLWLQLSTTPINKLVPLSLKTTRLPPGPVTIDKLSALSLTRLLRRKQRHYVQTSHHSWPLSYPGCLVSCIIARDYINMFFTKTFRHCPNFTLKNCCTSVTCHWLGYLFTAILTCTIRYYLICMGHSRLKSLLSTA